MSTLTAVAQIDAAAPPAKDSGSAAQRIASLDQFRGYTVLGMFLVNFVGSYAVIKESLPVLKHHHTFCSYADTIMPHFLFAVGMAYRMTFLRRQETSGKAAAMAHAWHRNLGLLLVAFFVHNLDGQYATWSELREVGILGIIQTGFQRSFFQTLAHIAVTSIWVLPVISASAGWRILYAVGSLVLFHGLSESWYYEWVMKRPGIDGGPLGFLTWTTPLLLGSLTWDAVSQSRSWNVVSRLFACSLLVMAVGYGISCLNLVSAPNSLPENATWRDYLLEPPFVTLSEERLQQWPVNIWTMSQRGGSVSYLVFGAGFSQFVYALFVVACDWGGARLGIFRTLGTNALVGYILHDLVNGAIKPFVPKDSPLWYVFAAFAVSLAICYTCLRHLEKHRLFLRL